MATRPPGAGRKKLPRNRRCLCFPKWLTPRLRKESARWSPYWSLPDCRKQARLHPPYWWDSPTRRPGCGHPERADPLRHRRYLCFATDLHVRSRHPDPKVTDPTVIQRHGADISVARTHHHPVVPRCGSLSVQLIARSLPWKTTPRPSHATPALLLSCVPST